MKKTGDLLCTAFDPTVTAVVFRGLVAKKYVVASGCGSAASRAFIVAAGAKKYDTTVYITQDEGAAKVAARHLEHFCDEPVMLVHAPKEDGEGSEYLLETALTLAKGGIVVMSYATSACAFPDVRAIEKKGYKLQTGRAASRTEVFNELIHRGYHSTHSLDDLRPGHFFVMGAAVHIMTPQHEHITLEIEEAIESITTAGKKENEVSISPAVITDHCTLAELIPSNSLVIADEIITQHEEGHTPVRAAFKETSISVLEMSSFPEDEALTSRQRYLSVLKYVTPLDAVHDFKQKKESQWRIVIATHKKEEVEGLLNEYHITFNDADDQLLVVSLHEEKILPEAFQNPLHKIMLVTDSELFGFQKQGRQVSEQSVYLDFITSLKDGDYVVHVDHGIALFKGLGEQTTGSITREYLQLHYAEEDKLFVPVDQAEKVSRFIGVGDTDPRLTRLGSSEWVTAQRKVKEEAQRMAKELLALYAKREMAKGFAFEEDNKTQEAFEKGFAYEETAGQLRAIQEVKRDMAGEKPMDRLLCGDVGFGKTEVAMRAAFKAALSGKQVAFIAPMTILADQHYRSFKKRLEPFNISIELLSRFQTAKEQTRIVQDLKDGGLSIVVGTHRLLQKDIAFKNLGLVILDEEQRFGVQQKETLKNMRAEVDILSMSATPIPRTLNMALNKLRDISTITTPPPGRLPIITEVRQFSWELIAEAVEEELSRGGQVYVLHNRVKTIDSLAARLTERLPKARVVVTHGQLPPDTLEERILAFKEGAYDVLVSSAIIENGIDLPNANTLIVDHAEHFGLSQLYQLRGRVGRGKRQAYAYFLYHNNTLKLDAKKRLRAIVEASEVGSGFEVAMKDLEIRGAGDILGSSQSGAINTIGVSHFVRLLNNTVDEMKRGDTKKEEVVEADVSIELPITAVLPGQYISDVKEKIRTYQRLSAADTHENVAAIRSALEAEYGPLPKEAKALLKIIGLKIDSKAAGVTAIKVGHMAARRREAHITLGPGCGPGHVAAALSANPNWSISGKNLKIQVPHLGADILRGISETIVAMKSPHY